MGGNFNSHFSVIHRARRRERLILFGVAGFAFCLLVLLVLSLNSDSATASKFDEASIEEAAPPELGSVTLYAPVSTIKVGQQLTAADFHEVYWPRNAVPADAITDLAAVAGRYSGAELQKGEPLKQAQLAGEALKTDTLDITPGMRAVTIEVNAKRGLEGWALPGTRVDVVLTYVTEGQLTSKIAVENAKVLSTGGDSTNVNERLGVRRSRVSASPTVTIEVTPKDALKIETAQQLGTLSLHMRAPDDNKASGIESYGRNDLENTKSDNTEKKKPTCKRGKMKIGGKDYIVDCDGGLTPIE